MRRVWTSAGLHPSSSRSFLVASSGQTGQMHTPLGFILAAACPDGAALSAGRSAVCQSTNQCYGDDWAKAVVVRKSVFTPTPKHPAWRLLLAIAAGSAAAIAIQFTEMLLNVL